HRGAAPRPRRLALEPRPGARVQGAPAPPDANGLLLTLRGLIPECQPPAGFGPLTGRSGRTSPCWVSTPLISATASSSAPIREDRPFSASATGSGRWTQSASGPSGL